MIDFHLTSQVYTPLDMNSLLNCLLQEGPPYTTKKASDARHVVVKELTNPSYHGNADTVQFSCFCRPYTLPVVKLRPFLIHARNPICRPRGNFFPLGLLMYVFISSSYMLTTISSVHG